MVMTKPTATTVIPGIRSVRMLRFSPAGRMSSSPSPASAGPTVTKARGPMRAAMVPTRLANRNDKTGVGKVAKPATVAE